MPQLAAWRDFYVMIGTAAGAITGATFVVATLAANLDKRVIGMRGFITPTAVHLGSVLLGAAILCVPTLTPPAFAILFGTAGIAAAAYGIAVAWRIWPMDLDLSDRDLLRDRSRARLCDHGGCRCGDGAPARLALPRDLGRGVGRAFRRRCPQRVGYGEFHDHARAGIGPSAPRALDVQYQ